jgi:hypothetical protein
LVKYCFLYCQSNNIFGISFFRLTEKHWTQGNWRWLIAFQRQPFIAIVLLANANCKGIASLLWNAPQAKLVQSLLRETVSKKSNSLQKKPLIIKPLTCAGNDEVSDKRAI